MDPCHFSRTKEAQTKRSHERARTVSTVASLVHTAPFTRRLAIDLAARFFTRLVTACGSVMIVKEGIQLCALKIST